MGKDGISVNGVPLTDWLDKEKTEEIIKEKKSLEFLHLYKKPQKKYWSIKKEKPETKIFKKEEIAMEFGYNKVSGSKVEKFLMFVVNNEQFSLNDLKKAFNEKKDISTCSAMLSTYYKKLGPDGLNILTRQGKKPKIYTRRDLYRNLTFEELKRMWVSNTKKVLSDDPVNLKTESSDKIGMREFSHSNLTSLLKNLNINLNINIRFGLIK